MYIGNLGTAGLFSFPNPLTSSVPPGALVQADNVVVSADGVVQSRRGITFIGNSIGLPTNVYPDSLFEYQNGWILHASDNSLWFSSSLTNPSWTEYSPSETFAPPSGQVRLHGVEANKNWYLTTSNGVYKQDAINHIPIPSGVPPALDGSGSLTGGSGFLLYPAQTAYRITWSYTDANGNLIEGAPSYRITVINNGSASANVSLTFSIPAGITTAYSYNIYRALQTASATVPATDNMQLAVQGNPSSAQITAGSVTVTDETPDTLLGATFYGSPSQQGATQYNYPPPLATDFCTFQGMTFYANATSQQNVYLTMITTPSDGDTLTINGVIYTAKTSGNNFALGYFGISTGGTPAINIDTTSKNLVSCINQYPSNTAIYAYYPVGYGDLPGLIYLQARDYTQAAFSITCSNGSVYQPAIPSTGSTYISSNDTLPNGVYISKLNEPEAVPLTNLIYIGGGDKPIYRVIALRDSVVVMKQDGVFRITGTTPDQLTVTPFDTTIILIAPDSAYTLNNTIFAITSQMVVSVSESGVNIESRNIEGTLLQASTLPYFQTATFGLSYESEREYLLCLPTSPGDQTATQIYVYNWLTQAWTHWLIAPTAGAVSFQPDNRLYLTPSYNTNYLYQEIKTYNSNGFDFGDDRYSVTITGVSGYVVSLSSVTDAKAENTLYQNYFSSVIKSVDIPNNQVTVSDLFSWENGAATVVVPFVQTVLTTPISANFTHYMKNFSKLIYNFSNANFSAITASCISDASLYSENWAIKPQINGAWGLFNWGDLPWGGTSFLTQAITTMPPRNKMLAHWVQVGLSLNQALSNFQFLGCSLTYDIVADTSR